MSSAPEDPNNVDALQRQIAELQARLVAAQKADVSGSGAVAQGGGDAVGERGVKLRDNAGTIVTGTQIVKHYHSAGRRQLSREQIGEKVASYLRWLRSRTENIELRGIERAGGAPVVLLPIRTAYVPLRAKPIWRSGDTVQQSLFPAETMLAYLRELGGEDSDVTRNELFQIGDAFSIIGDRRSAKPDALRRLLPYGERGSDVELNRVLAVGDRVVITGGPGSGKTTVLLNTAWALASSLLTGESEPASSRLGLGTIPAGLPLPIFVPLASFARYRRNMPADAPAHARTLAHFISYHLISKQADFDLPRDFFLQLLSDGRDVLLLLDGLDEVANEADRAEVRQAVEDLVGGRERIRVIVTCRTIAYRSGRTALGADFREISVQPLDFDQHVAPMVRQAYACIYPHDAALRSDRATELLDGIRRLEEERQARLGLSAERLVDSPLMVRLLLIVHVNNRRLPDERADLFDKAINALLQVDYGREETDIRELSTDWKLFRDMAQHLAFHMHQQGRNQGREIDEPALRMALRSEAEFLPRIEAFLIHARQRGSVLEERDGAYRFIHLAFQEFLVARYLREVIGGESRRAILAFLNDRLEDPWWREPILLLVGYMGANAARSTREFLRSFVAAGKTPRARFAAADLAATAALEWRESGEIIRAECAQQIFSLLSDADALTHSEPAVRARAGDALSRLSDPRFNSQLFYLPADDMLGFVYIRSEERREIGSWHRTPTGSPEVIRDEGSENEISYEGSPTSRLYVAKYPVTVAQFRTFTETTGFRVRDPNALCDPYSRPVRFVSWHDALAYCNWLNVLLSSVSALRGYEVSRLVREEGWQVALPSEVEWEMAARGIPPHGVQPPAMESTSVSGNYRDLGIGTTSVVGCFPFNGFGIYDMAGNLWEWTRSPWESSAESSNATEDRKPEGVIAGDRIFRIVRGGSWDDNRGIDPHGMRGRAPPESVGLNVGFRVVLRPPLSP